MKLKKVAAMALSAAMVLGVLLAPEGQLQVKAAGGVYINNKAKDIPAVSIQTPQEIVRLHSGISWAGLEENVSVRLNVTEAVCGPLAKKALRDRAASLGASEVAMLSMDMEYYLGSGWSQDVKEINGALRVCIWLPEGSDLTKDYAVISLRKDSVTEVLGDLDPEPGTITVDSDYYDTFMIVSGPKGTFDAYKTPDPHALDNEELPVYVKKINGSTINTESKAYEVRSLGVLTDEATVIAAAGGRKVSLRLTDVLPGEKAKTALQQAVERECGKKADEIKFNELELVNDKGQRIINTSEKLMITITVPYYFPAYADYAVAVLNADGSVSILKDMDGNPSTVTISTDQFRTCVFLWGKEGAFD